MERSCMEMDPKKKKCRKGDRTSLRKFRALERALKSKKIAEGGAGKGG